MTANRDIGNSTTPGAITGDDEMDDIREEIQKLYDVSFTTLINVAGTNTITADYDPPLSGALVDGMKFLLVPANTNTSATVTLNGKDVLDRDGAGPLAGALAIGSQYPFVYRAATDSFYCLAFLPPLDFSDRPSFRNVMLDNGGFELWQRGAGDSASIGVAASTTAYTADRWYLTTGANQACTIQAAAGLVSRSKRLGAVFRNSGQTGTATLVFAYPLTTEECIRLRDQRITLQFLAAAGANFSPTSGTLTYNVYFGTGGEGKRGAGFTSESNPITGSVNLTPGGATATVTATSAASVGATVTQGEVRFTWTPTGTAGASDFVALDNVQLEAGVTATEFEYAPFAFMLALCQRHYAKTFPYGTAPAQNAGFAGALSGHEDISGAISDLKNTNNGNAGAALSGSVAPGTFGSNTFWQFPARMRTAPTITTFNPAAANANWRLPGGNNNAAVDATRTINPSSNNSECGVTIMETGNTTFGGTMTPDDIIPYIHATADASL